ncbi:MAG: hypothetical protein LC785_07875, partial [Acidobacteria bacterium]|nr:hypothetical protein [Acidobacteriota bacterium]MCA1641851.1 hypothetical protein [Acidobacteriota bacterium]
MKRVFVSSLLLIFAAAAIVRGQSMPPPPNVLLIVREDIKPGEMPAHEQEAMSFVRLQRRANERLPADARAGRIAMSPIAGNENEVMYLSAYDSFADMGKKRDEMDKLSAGAMRADFERLPDARLHAAQRDMIAALRPDLSYNLGKGIDVAQARFMSVQTLRIKPGNEDVYWSARKRILHAAFDKAGSSVSYAVFQVRGGALGSTYLIFRPIKSLADLDTNLPAMARTQMGADRDDWDKVIDKSVVVHDVSFYAFN